MQNAVASVPAPGGAVAPTSPRHPRLKIAMIGTRGVPAHYGGFETAVEEVGPAWSTAGTRSSCTAVAQRRGRARIEGCSWFTFLHCGRNSSRR